jgi:hypothetical protein
LEESGEALAGHGVQGAEDHVGTVVIHEVVDGRNLQKKIMANE